MSIPVFGFKENGTKQEIPIDLVWGWIALSEDYTPSAVQTQEIVPYNRIWGCTPDCVTVNEDNSITVKTKYPGVILITYSLRSPGFVPSSDSWSMNYVYRHNSDGSELQMTTMPGVYSYDPETGGKALVSNHFAIIPTTEEETTFSIRYYTNSDLYTLKATSTGRGNNWVAFAVI